MPGRKYVKLFVDKWFYGTTRQELKPDERSIFIDLLVMSGMSAEPGKVLINHGVGYPLPLLADALKVPLKTLESALKKMQQPSGGDGKPKISIDKDGVITVNKWREYQSNWDEVKDSDSQQFKDISKIPPDTKKVFAYYKKKVQPNCRPLDKHMRKIAARLRTYKAEELMEAVDKFAANDWWMKNNSYRGASWFFGSDDRIEKSLNIQPNAGNRARQVVDKRD